MAKRAVREKASQKPKASHNASVDHSVRAEPEEIEWAVGRLVSYYYEGWRYGHIVELNVDDDGELEATLQPVFGKNVTVKPRKVTEKIKDLKLV